MSFFDIFKKEPKFVDELFGELSYTTFKDNLKNFYEGTVIFNSQETGVLIDADENGPSQAQRDFYLFLTNNYTSIKNILIPFLQKELEDWLNGSIIADFDKEFLIDGIALPRINGQPVSWSITFYSVNIKHYVTVEFIDQKPREGVIVDG